MTALKKALRLLFMILLLLLAAFGIGLTGNFLNGNKERYMDNEIRTEQSVQKKDEDEDAMEEIKN